MNLSASNLLRNSATLASNSLPGVLSEDQYWPPEPASLEDAGLSETLVESLICQVLLAVGTTSGRKIAERLGLPFGILDQQLGALRTRQIVAHARSAPLNDFYYSLTENGQNRAIAHRKSFTYVGPAPVPLADYVVSVEAQASQFEPIRRDQLIKALADITFERQWLDFLGPAVNGNGGIFLYGPPGNGKTTLAKCLTALRGESVWIPHAIIDDGVIIKLFDPAYHKLAERSVPGVSQGPNLNNINIDSTTVFQMQDYDRRWVRIQRPTVVVGGELTLDNLEIRHDQRSNICEAPLQLKSNCGSLLVDDFGRQRVAPEELLNRWIVPLENRQDFLTLPTGKKIVVPFEQIILFSTNLQPQDLVDEAFLRRVPFKIEITNPCEAEFTELFRRACQTFGLPWRPEVVQQLIKEAFHRVGRPLRRCYARDLLVQVRAYCAYMNEPLDLRFDYLQHACRNYFGNLIAGNTGIATVNTVVAQPVAASAPTATPVATPVAAPAPAPSNVSLSQPVPAAPASQGMPSQPLRPSFVEPVMPPVSMSQQPFATAAVSMSMLGLPNRGNQETAFESPNAAVTNPAVLMSQPNPILNMPAANRPVN